MKTKLLFSLFIFFILNKNLHSQEIISTPCFNDDVQSTSSFPSERDYTRYDIRFESPISSQILSMNELYNILSGSTFYSYGRTDTDTDCANSTPANGIFALKTTIKVELLKDGQVEDTVLAETTYNVNDQVSAFRDDLKNYSPKNGLISGSGYKLLFTVRIRDLESYVDPFDRTVTRETSTFTLTSTTLSVSKNEIQGFELYPNPTKDNITISAQTTIDNIEIYNLLGKKVISKKISHTKATINTSLLAKGIYLINVYSGSLKTIQKLVKE